MDKVLFSITKTGFRSYVLEDKVDRKTYKFQDLGEIIDAFSSTDHPRLPSDNRVVMSVPQQNKVLIIQRTLRNDKKSIPKYFWSDSGNSFDHFEQISVREVLKNIKKNKEDW